VKYLYVGFGALIVAVGLAACGGGGGGGGMTPPGGGGHGPTPQAATYTGSETIANVYHSYPCGAPCGDPNVTPYPNNTVTNSLSDSLSSTKGSGAVIASETVTEPNQTLTESLTTFVTPSPNGSVTNVTVTRQVYSDSDGYTQSLTYPTPLVVDQEPENNNATWTNAAMLTTAESYSGGESINRTTNADGSYVETEVDNNTGVNNTATVNSDASGSWEAASGSAGFYSGFFTGFTWTAPSAGNVTFTATEYTGATSQLVVPQFFSTSPLTLASNASKITTGVTFPGACSVPSKYGTSGNDIHTIVTGLDPLFGFTETTTTDAYTSTTYGLVCVQSTDLLETYYDWNGDEHYFLYANNTPLIDTTTTTTLTLKSGGGLGVTSANSRSTESLSSSGSSIASGLDAAVLAQSLVRGEQLRLRALAQNRVLTTIAHRVNGAKP
jgi:hypothetical protein